MDSLVLANHFNAPRETSTKGKVAMTKLLSAFVLFLFNPVFHSFKVLLSPLLLGAHRYSPHRVTNEQILIKQLK